MESSVPSKIIMVDDCLAGNALVQFHSVAIPTKEWFLNKWHNWIHLQVSKQFKRDKDRILDTAQVVRLRLLAKEFVGRWFYKHLTDELVDRKQAELMLGGLSLLYMCPEALAPAYGVKRGDSRKNVEDTSLWRVSDILAFARFDHERYFYSPQGHTIDSDMALWLLGYGPGQYTALQSLYRQSRVLPSEFTEHACKARLKCPECQRGRDSLRGRRLSTAHDWADPSVKDAVRRLRWNDLQMAPYLGWQKKNNRIKQVPEYIMRRDPSQQVEAGLLKYAKIIINHEVVNEFKRLSRTDDLHMMVLNGGVSPGTGDDQVMAYESDDSEEMPDLVFRDPHAHSEFNDRECRHDLDNLISGCSLSPDEEDVLRRVELGDASVREYSDETGVRVPRIHRLRASVTRKLGSRVASGTIDFDAIADRVAADHGCTRGEMLSGSRVGACVVARAEFFARMSDEGLSSTDIATLCGFDEERVASGIVRAAIRESRPPTQRLQP